MLTKSFAHPASFYAMSCWQRCHMTYVWSYTSSNQYRLSMGIRIWSRWAMTSTFPIGIHFMMGGISPARMRRTNSYVGFFW